MSYNDPDIYLDDQHEDVQDDPRQVTLSRDQIRSMERDAKQVRTLRRENAMLKAGIDVNTPLGTLFLNAYEGELETDAIRDAFHKIAPPAPVTATEAEEPDMAPVGDNDDAQFAEERQRLASGGLGDDGHTIDRDPRKVAIELGNKMLADGKSREDAMASAFSSMAGAAAAGDSRVIWNP